MKFGQRETKTSVNFNSFKPSAAFMVPSTDGRARGIWSNTFMSKSPVFTRKDGLSDGDSGPRRVAVSRAASRKMKRGYSGRFRGQYGSGKSALYLIPNGAMGLLGFEARMSRGIVGARFLDAGANYLNRNYGQELSKLLEQWRNSANSAGKRVAEGRSLARVSPNALGPPTAKDRGDNLWEGLDLSTPQAFTASGGIPNDLADVPGGYQALLAKWRRAGNDVSGFPRRL
jgi:hypothetical protein